ncbi:MAG: uroporphyrinogen decarboxylase [Bacteroides sp. SM23_62]|nr:MAG: uroporphyrinogen decarboxylase [Bacteroides sp. SM23_62]
MTEKQWSTIQDVINGKEIKPLPVGFIIDSPWLPNWYGIKILDYFSCDDLWFKANLKVVNEFPEIIFLPGFWSEFGMCSEPSAFGAICSFPPDDFPHPKKNIFSIEDIRKLSKPNPETDGFSPLIINRLLLNANRIEDSGHKIYFSVSRGPMNIASYLMGVSEFLTAMITNPDEIHHLINMITEYLIEWHDLQQDTFPTIDGIMMLDDILGFIGETEFEQFGLPYLKRIYDRDLSVKCLHNDADCRSSIKYLPEMGINLFNMGFDTYLNELKSQTDNKVTMLGNIPPRDVLANGSSQEIEKHVKDMIQNLDRKSGVIASCGGGMPPGVSTESINFFANMVAKYS